VDAATNLPGWTPLLTHCANAPPFYFFDSTRTNLPWSCHRARRHAAPTARRRPATPRNVGPASRRSLIALRRADETTSFPHSSSIRVDSLFNPPPCPLELEVSLNFGFWILKVTPPGP